MNFALFLFGLSLLVATGVTPAASADERDASCRPEEASLAPASGTSGPPAVPDRSGVPKTLGIDVKIDGNGFRLGGRLLGSKGVSEAWLSGRVRDDGATIDGRLKGEDGPARDFTLNLDLLPGWARTAARIWLLLP